MRFSALMIAVLIFVYGCQSATFIVRKGESTRAYYLGVKSKHLHKTLCESGDFLAILKDTKMREALKKKMYKYVCIDQSREKVFSLYQFLSPEEKDSLKRAFRMHDYDVNYVPC